MIPNQANRIITIPVTRDKKLGIFLKTNYTPNSFFDYFFTQPHIIKYPSVSRIDHTSIAYKHGLRAGNTITRLNNISFREKDIKTIQSDFAYEIKTSVYIKLTIV